MVAGRARVMTRRWVVGVLGLALALGRSGRAERPPVSISSLGLNDRHTFVRPEVTHYLAPGDHHTRLQEKQHREQFSFTVVAYGEQLEVVLYRSDDLMSGRYAHVWRDPNGTLVHSRRHAVDHCFYHGKVVREPRSIVTAHTCGEGIEASIRRASGEHLMVIPGSRVVEMRGRMPAVATRHLQDAASEHVSTRLPPHLLFRSSDQRLPGCPISHLAKVAAPIGYLDSRSFEQYSGGFTPLVLQRDGDRHRGLQTVLVPLGGCTCLSSWAYGVGGVLHEYPNGGCHNPDNDPSGSWCFTEAQCGLGGTDSYQYCEEVDEGTLPPPPPPPPSIAGCRYHVEVLMANDHTAVERVQGDLAAAQEHALLVANGVKEIYQEMSELQICITLVAVHSFATESEEGALYTSPDATIETFLDNWSDWYEVNAIENFQGSGIDLSSDNGVLLTNVDRSGSTTGLGWVGTMCNRRMSSSVVEENQNGIWQYTAETMAHEMGHNFGSNHDGVGEAAGCDDSAFIMAAVGCGNCPFSQFKAWSTCSVTYIQDKLQALANTPSDCLQNNPRAPVCAPGEDSCSTCGDFIVSGDEDCDVGAAGNSLCNGAASASPCHLAAGVDCASGECCDTSTGQFKASGNLCRNAMHQCDLPDYCSGTSAVCGADLFKADGTSCTESGPGSRCYVGSCVGLDGQCGNAFQGYTGTWVAAARNGVDASCTQPNDGCGELQCTNTAWDGYCQTYDCPANYRCTVDDLVLEGPATHSFCSCDAKAELVSDPMQRVMIADGTPCGPPDEDNICLSNVCTPRPVASESDGAAPDDSVQEPDVNCDGAWSICDASCQKVYTISTQQSGSGLGCPAAAGDTESCEPGVDECPPDIDCQGAWSDCSDSCAQVFSVTQPQSGSGAACEAANSATRVCAAGVGNCPAVSNHCVDAGSCSNRGTCARNVEGTLACACDPGWTGAICSEQILCSHDCHALLRHPCISPASCGTCLPGHWHTEDHLLPGAACDLLPLSTVDPLSVVISISANVKAGTSHPDVVMDTDIYSHWVSDYDESMSIDQKPRVVITYSDPVTLTHYSIMSANAHPSEDPKSWFLECYIYGEWRQVDTRVDEMFDMRHQSRVYAIGGNGISVTCSQLALHIVGIRDAETQGGGTIQATIGPSETDTGDLDVSHVSSIVEGYSAQVQIAEMQFFRRVSPDWFGSLPTTEVSATITLDADFDAIGSDVDEESYRSFVSVFKSDAAGLLGVSEDQIVINSVMAASVLVNFTVSPDEHGRSLSVVALSTAFSRPGISLAGATTTSTISSDSILVAAVSVGSTLTAGSSDSVRASGSEPQEDDQSIVAMVVFVVMVMLLVLGIAYACGNLNATASQQPEKQSGDDIEIAKPLDGDEDDSDEIAKPLDGDEDDSDALSPRPPPLPSVARIELTRCLRAAPKALDSAQVHRQFDELDIDRDGSLTREEVHRFVTESLGYSPSADFLNGVFAAFDQDRNGTLSEDEFAQMLKIVRTYADDEQQQQEQQQQP